MLSGDDPSQCHLLQLSHNILRTDVSLCTKYAVKGSIPFLGVCRIGYAQLDSHIDAHCLDPLDSGMSETS